MKCSSAPTPVTISAQATGVTEARCVLYLAEPDPVDASQTDIDIAVRLSAEVADLVRGLAERDHYHPATLWIITRGAQQLGMFGVAEAERLAGRKRNGDAPCDATAHGALGAPRLGDDMAARCGDHGGKVHVLCDKRGHGVDCGARVTAVLDGGDQAEMS